MFPPLVTGNRSRARGPWFRPAAFFANREPTHSCGPSPATGKDLPVTVTRDHVHWITGRHGGSRSPHRSPYWTTPAQGARLHRILPPGGPHLIPQQSPRPTRPHPP